MSEHPHFDSALIALDGERVVQPILIRRDTMRALTEQAAYKRITPQALIARLLDTLARDDLFAAVLDR